MRWGIVLVDIGFTKVVLRLVLLRNKVNILNPIEMNALNLIL